MIYELPNGQTVRMRTCNDHILIVVADNPSSGAKLNIEGTDWLLIVMPEIERTPGRVIAYLIPALEAVGEARRTHSEWLATNPGTKGGNTTWNLWFRPDGTNKAGNYAEKWMKYKLTVPAQQMISPGETTTPSNIKLEVETARQRISAAAGVPVEAVSISIDFAA